MRIVFAGTPEVAVPSLEALSASNHELIGVVTRPDRPKGRGRKPSPAPVAEVAAAAGLPLLKPDHPSDPEFLAGLRDWAPEAVATVAYGALLPEDALAIPKHGWVNLHFSLLPAWRGAAPVQHAIWHGDQITGATTFQIVRQLDAGPVFGVMTYEPPPRATAGEALQALAADGAKLLVATMDAIADGTARPEPQSAEGVSYAAKISVADARVDWNAHAQAIDRQIRACTPDPGAWTTFRGGRLKLGPVLPTPAAGRVEGRVPPGVLSPGKERVVVGTATDPVVLSYVAPAGKKWMAAEAWARGARIEDGERFGK